MENANSTTTPVVKTTRERRSEEEILSLMQDFERSEMTPEEFIETMNISKQTFYNWQEKYNRSKAGTFAQFEIATDEHTTEERKLFAEIRIKADVVISFYEKVDASFIKALM